jgi:hypothetical protein
MVRSPKASPPRELAKWCTYALLLLAPGSFVILPVLWLYRLLGAPRARR